LEARSYQLLEEFMEAAEQFGFVILAYLRKLPANQAVAPPARQLWHEARSTLADTTRSTGWLPWGGTSGSFRR